MRKALTGVAVAVSLAVVAAPATAQTLFTGSGCGGDQFKLCASWTATYVDFTHFSLFITNTSGTLAGNPGSVFTQIGVGNVTVADPSSMAAVTGWQFDAVLNGFNGYGLLANSFGAITTNGLQNGLTAGNSLTFDFTFGSSIGSFATAQTAFAGAQIAIHDQGCTPSSRTVLPGSGTSTSTAPEGCAVNLSAVPEPGTTGMLAIGLLGLFAIARRRRARA